MNPSYSFSYLRGGQILNKHNKSQFWQQWHVWITCCLLKALSVWTSGIFLELNPKKISNVYPNIAKSSKLSHYFSYRCFATFFKSLEASHCSTKDGVSENIDHISSHLDLGPGGDNQRWEGNKKQLGDWWLMLQTSLGRSANFTVVFPTTYDCPLRRPSAQSQLFYYLSQLFFIDSLPK